MKRRVWLLIVGVLVLLAVIYAVVVSNRNGNGADGSGGVESPSDTSDSSTIDPTATPTPPPEPTPEPLPVPVQASTGGPTVEGEDAERLVEPFLLAEGASRENPDVPLALDEVATGMALDDLNLAAFEFVENGMVQVGMPNVVSAVVVSLDAAATPPTAVVEVCLDYSGVDFVAPGGESVKSTDAPSRVPSILTLQEVGGRWLVAERTFPDESTC